MWCRRIAPTVTFAATALALSIFVVTLTVVSKPNNLGSRTSVLANSSGKLFGSSFPRQQARRVNGLDAKYRPYCSAQRLNPASAFQNPTAGTTAAGNPLLEIKRSPFPAYDRITPADVISGMRTVIKETEDGLEALESKVSSSWSGLIEPLERLSDPLERAWGAVQHLKMVKDSEDLRKAVEEIQPAVVSLGLKIGQSRALHGAFAKIRASPDYPSYSQPRQRIVDAQILSAELSGVALEGKQQEEFNAIQQRLAELSTTFANNVLDGTKAFKATKTTKEEVDGLPKSALALAAQTAKAMGEEGATAENGPWVFTLDIPSFQAVMTYASDRTFRETLYKAYLTRASEIGGGGDNSPIIKEILALRRKKAALLDYEHHAAVSMANKMATLDSALALCEDLRAASHTAGKGEHADLQRFAEENHGVDYPLKQWDTGYYAEKMRQSLFDLDEEALRPYFSLPKVLEGLFGLIQRLFNVEVVEASFRPPTWDEHVLFYQVNSMEGEPLAFFYLDPFTRPAEKRGGAWMDTVAGRSALLAPEGEGMRLPIAHMVLNQAPPVGDQPSLMRFREVETLFHEMGHALQHMLTTQTEGMVAGINGVEWDAVEQPSQFMENWLYDRKTLMGMAEHYETGEKLPAEEFEKINKARTFRSGTAMLRQLHFATTDLLLHSSHDPEASPYDLDREVASKHEALSPMEYDRFLNSFSHIFAGGYSAGYYSYKWAEVLSADCFAAFEEAGLDNEQAVKETGIKFRDTVLSLGGGVPPMEVFKEFRGREPSVKPLLKHTGLAK